METMPKAYKMLKTTTGSRDGIKVEAFNKGETYHDLPEELAEQFYHQGVIEEVAAKKNPAESRETKVVAPAEAKDGEAGVPLATQHIEELVAVARDKYGLDVDSTMSEAQIRKLIEDARGDGEEGEPAKAPKPASKRKK